MKESNQKIENKYLTVPRVSKLLFMYEPSFLLNPVVSVLELSDPARSIKCYKQKFRTNAAETILKKMGMFYAWRLISIMSNSVILKSGKQKNKDKENYQL